MKLYSYKRDGMYSAERIMYVLDDFNRIWKYFGQQNGFHEWIFVKPDPHNEVYDFEHYDEVTSGDLLNVINMYKWIFINPISVKTDRFGTKYVQTPTNWV